MMWEDEESDLLEEMERKMNSILQTLAGAQGNLFDIDDRSLKPLYNIEVNDDEVAVTLDLPCVEKSDISLTSTEDTLSVVAKMRKPISLRLGGTMQRRHEFEKYSKKIRLPVKVNPENAKATFKNGLLLVRYGTARKGSALKIR